MKHPVVNLIGLPVGLRTTVLYYIYYLGSCRPLVACLEFNTSLGQGVCTLIQQWSYLYSTISDRIPPAVVRGV